MSIITLAELRHFNGVQSAENPESKIYVCVRGKVYDVTRAAHFYGPGESYHIFAGHDASRALAKTALSPEELDQPIEDLDETQKNTLNDWIKKYDAKYPVVATVSDAPSVSAASAPAQEEQKQAESATETKEEEKSAEDPHKLLGKEPQRELIAEALLLRSEYEAAKRGLLSLEQLARYRGGDSVSGIIYVAVRGLVFDVSSGANDMYGPNQSHHIYAGHDISVALVKNSLESKDLDQPLSDLTSEELNELKGFAKQYAMKYPVVGRVELTHIPSSLLKLTLEQLRQFSADHNSSTLYVSVRGKIFDVSSSPDFQSPAGRFSPLPGYDASVCLARKIIDPSLFNQSFLQLSYDEMTLLEGWERSFETIFPVAGEVIGWEPAESLRCVAVPRIYTTNWHLHVENGDLDALRSELERDNSCVNQVCPRTGLTALHKAIEQGRADLVAILFQNGADINAPAPLYDNETPIQMAQRFRQDDIVALLTSKNSDEAKSQ